MAAREHNIHPQTQSGLTDNQVRRDGRSSQARGKDVGALSRADIARFWSKVRRTSGCWIWTGSVDAHGYGQFGACVEGVRRNLKAHRTAWSLERGSPVGFDMIHHCDNTRCVNPAHLSLGTQDDNMKDAASKGRLTVPRHRKLTHQDRLNIYNAPRGKGTGQELAAQYGVSETCISLIRKGRFVTHAKAKKERAA